MKKYSSQRKLASRIIVAVLAIIMGFSFIMGAVLANSARTPMNIRRSTVEATTATQQSMTSARGMATVEVSSGRLLYAKNEHDKLPMASTTKIMTAITVIENVSDLDEKIKVSDKAIGIEGTSIYLQKGEELTVRELLYGLMLRSGNDAASALALHVSKTNDEFSALMNKVATKAGAKNSSFKNPHGLDQEGHYTTAYDLAMISAYAMRNPQFAEIAATKEKRISGVEYPRVLQNKNRLLRSNKNIVGVKTGFTSKAGRCYVGAMETAGMTVVCAVLNCGPMFPESEAIMTQSGKEYEMVHIIQKNTLIKPTFPDRHNRTGIAKEDFFYPLMSHEKDKIEITINEHDICVYFDNKIIKAMPYVLEKAK
ncbi:MAG: D-alanyl-D-alanine carboxypeptidase [Firmicutes bacterium]|nr:D-alanyl-D-alanine carboxypeptidase [Bacillota bacterium]